MGGGASYPQVGGILPPGDIFTYFHSYKVAFFFFFTPIKWITLAKTSLIPCKKQLIYMDFVNDAILPIS